MSEDFDKEAEREKLREQFEREEKRRQATRQMSDLLLKGATMTNKHCDQCGSPIFRYEGQEFCPECQATMGEEGQAMGKEEEGNGEREGRAPAGRAEAESPPAEDGATPKTPGEAAEPTSETEPTPGPDPTADARPAGEPETPSSSDSPDAGSASTDSDLGHPTVRPDDAPGSRRPSRQREPAVEAGGVPSKGDTGDLADAQASLQQTLARFADRAAETDDPRQAREYLAAAREAAEALAALRR